ncbi:hypothetical protein LTR05_007341 [Lithohypha guttulata]|uniref:DUF427 domain-containing protein n=1 Tax=Lithohypha guttulata TaxID=1690604 RepID=A0AAN7SUX4_9EURO|nr:hypothetical protein LTR05_007341 [Lithohypha guttulata]
MSRLLELGSKLLHPRQEFRPKIVDTEKRVRGVLDGHYIFDTTRAKLVWEIPYFPQFWIPKDDFLPAANFKEDAPISGIQSSTSKLTAGGKTISSLLIPLGYNTELAGYVKVEFKDLDAWYEEMVQVFYHPKDPFHRIDVLPSGRQVKVELAGKTLADTRGEGGVLSLWETNFPGRWYLPPTAVNWEYLKPSQTKTGCPYKGEANYYNAVIDGKEHKDVVWYYQNPTSESAAIRGLLCFYPDKVDTYVDGKPIAKIGMPPMSKADKESVQQPHSGCNC